jgi:hypothetical protein
MRTFTLLLLGFLAGATGIRAADMVIQPVPTFQRDDPQRQWKKSLIPLVASQGLDVASSWGMRELNPVLADSRGAFGAKAASIKFGATAGLIGIEYLLVKKYPRSARVLAKLNWSGAALTTGFAVHNFAVK